MVTIDPNEVITHTQFVTIIIVQIPGVPAVCPRSIPIVVLHSVTLQEFMFMKLQDCRSPHLTRYDQASKCLVLTKLFEALYHAFFIVPKKEIQQTAVTGLSERNSHVADEK